MNLKKFILVFWAFLSISTYPDPKKVDKESVHTQEALQLKEIVLGRKIAAFYAKKYGVHRNPENTRYLQSVGNRISENSNIKNLIFYFGILDTNEIILRALPGGYVFISKGLINKLSNEAQLAYLLATCIVHINMNHSLKIEENSIKYFGILFPFQNKQDYFLENDKLIQKLISKLEKGFPLEEEKEAQEASMLLASSSGYNSKHFIPALKHLYKGKDWDKKQSTLEEYKKKQGISETGDEFAADFEYFQKGLNPK
jgi:hypothetical protein